MRVLPFRGWAVLCRKKNIEWVVAASIRGARSDAIAAYKIEVSPYIQGDVDQHFKRGVKDGTLRVAKVTAGLI